MIISRHIFKRWDEAEGAGWVGQSDEWKNWMLSYIRVERTVTVHIILWLSKQNGSNLDCRLPCWGIYTIAAEPLDDKGVQDVHGKDVS